MSWSHYEDESGIYFPEKYYIYKKSVGTDSLYSLLDSIPGNYNQYSDNNLTNGTTKYYVSCKHEICNISGSQTYSQDILSNISSLNLSGIEDVTCGEIKLYPDPTTGIVTIKAPGLQKVILYDISGKILKEKEINNRSEYIFDLSDYAKGMYIVKIVSLEKSVSINIVKK